MVIDGSYEGPIFHYRIRFIGYLQSVRSRLAIFSIVLIRRDRLAFMHTSPHLARLRRFFARRGPFRAWTQRFA